TLTSCNTSV
nr:Chain C, HIV-1 GP120 ENVELOPE PROTEIN (RESIDUES 195-207) [Human immunodeficiency virus 1]1HHG_F Chain F, HIV-1 GP120 ENVELOPE PROTEIN (RESIDUES 195-207) [Human immunodeficiency virus 1]4I48_C Chain C, 9-mer peptide from Envelope glycoprotein gp160 [Human immunodeficiency virus type 1 lw12.3 isolate]